MAWWIKPDILKSIGFVRNDTERITSAWHKKSSNLLVEVDARVVLLLPNRDDIKKLQRFLVELENGHRLEVAHDLELSENVPVGVSSLIRLKGEFDYNENGGLIHWTHADPAGNRDGGWIEHNDMRYD